MQENMHQQVHLPPICSLACLALGRIKSFYKRHFHNVPFNFVTNQGHGTGRYLEDRGINVVITASNKNACRHL